MSKKKENKIQKGLNKKRLDWDEIRLEISRAWEEKMLTCFV